MSETEEILETQTDLLLDDDDDDDLFIKPVKKSKILVLSDHPLAPSGVGVQARFLIEGLIKTGKYTFRCLGGAMKHANYQTVKVNDDFIIKPVDGFGNPSILREILITEKPDALLLFTDPRQFTWVWQMEDEIRQICPITYWHVWDNDPYPQFNSKWYESTDLINCLSYKTYELVKEHFPDKTNYIPHAFPKEVFFPIPDQQIEQLQKNNFHDRADWFKVLWVNRNATRKMPADILDMWRIFLDRLEEKHGHRNALLLMHTDPNDNEGPALLECAQAFGLKNHVWFSTDKLDFNHMNILYNMSDTCINIAKNEGFGLSALTTLQVGKPIIALKTGGLTRQVVNHKDGTENGVALEPVKRVMVGSQLVPYIYEDYVSTEDTVNAFMKIYEMTDEDKAAMKKKVLDYVDDEFSYPKIIEEWNNTLDKCITDFKSKLELKKNGTGGGDWSLIELNVISNEKENNK